MSAPGPDSDRPGLAGPGPDRPGVDRTGREPLRPEGRLADALRELGYVTDRRWAAAFAGVPRPPARSGTVGSPHPETTGLAWVLGLLDPGVRPVRVLHVGADAGYAVALLCHGFGDRHVVAAQVRPDLAGALAGELSGLGRYPEVLAGPPGPVSAEHGPYDAILVAPDAMPMPPACLAQLASRGRIVVGPIDDGDRRSAVLLDRAGDGAVRARRVDDPHRAGGTPAVLTPRGAATATAPEW